MTKLEEWEKELKILSHHELDLLKEYKKVRGQMRSSIKDFDHYKILERTTQYAVCKVVKKLRTFDKATQWINEKIPAHQYSESLVRKIYYKGRVLNKMVKRIHSSLSQKGISKNDKDALETLAWNYRYRVFKKVVNDIISMHESLSRDIEKKRDVTEEEAREIEEKFGLRDIQVQGYEDFNQKSTHRTSSKKKKRIRDLQKKYDKGSRTVT